MNSLTRRWKKAATLCATGLGMAASLFLMTPDIASAGDIKVRGYANTRDAHYHKPHGHGRSTTSFNFNLYGMGTGGYSVSEQRGRWYQEEGVRYDRYGNRYEYLYEGRLPRYNRQRYDRHEALVPPCPRGQQPVIITSRFGQHLECR